jgi:hypothetical protein
MTDLIRQNAEQMRRSAAENSKQKQNRNVKSVQSKIYSNNPFSNDYYNLSNIKKSNAHKVAEQYLDQDTALKEFEDLCENYQLYRIKDQILDLQKTTISRDHDAFTIRSTAKLVDMIAEEIFTKHDIK